MPQALNRWSFYNTFVSDDLSSCGRHKTNEKVKSPFITRCAFKGILAPKAFDAVIQNLFLFKDPKSTSASGEFSKTDDISINIADLRNNLSDLFNITITYVS